MPTTDHQDLLHGAPRGASAAYLRLLALLVGGAAAAVMVFNGLVDPYHMYRESSRQGLNHFKVGAFGKYDRMVKAENLFRDKPEAVLLGSSRVAWALDPHHPRLQERGCRTINAGLAGATFYEVFRYLQHAQACHPLELAVVGLDLEQFNLPGSRVTFSEDRLAVSADGRRNPFHRVNDRIDSLATLDALRASIRCLQDSRKARDVPEADLPLTGWRYNGKRSPEERASEYEGTLHEAHRNFQPLRHQGKRIRVYLDWYRKMLQFAHEQDIELKLFITPYHASTMKIMEQYEGMPMFERWKQSLWDINLESAEAAGREPFAFYDFSMPSAITTEPLPYPDRPTLPMQYYRESSHYRKNVGTMILDRVLGDEPIEDGFGIKHLTDQEP